jgi:GH24 family phage-related lysozyme (muramidase)
MTPEPVRSAFIPFTDPLEGVERGMYPDSVGLITTARGCLIDPGPRRLTPGAPIGNSYPVDAVVLPFKRRVDGAPATVAEIAGEWWRLKRAWPGLQSDAAARSSSLWLDMADVDSMTLTRLDGMWATLLHWFPDAESYPAPGQLGLLSMAWAMGSAFAQGYPHFAAAVRARDWTGAADQCAMNQQPVPVRRNALNKKLFLGAAAGLDIDGSLAA